MSNPKEKLVTIALKSDYTRKRIVIELTCEEAMDDDDIYNALFDYISGYDEEQGPEGEYLN